jgi:hypothetical protein
MFGMAEGVWFVGGTTKQRYQMAFISNAALACYSEFTVICSIDIKLFPFSAAFHCG